MSRLLFLLALALSAVLALAPSVEGPVGAPPAHAGSVVDAQRDGPAAVTSVRSDEDDDGDDNDDDNDDGDDGGDDDDDGDDNGDNDDGDGDNDNGDDGHDNDNGDDDDDGDDNDNDDEDDDEESPPPPPPAVAAPPPPDVAGQCLQNGESLTILAPNGGVAVKAFQNNLFVQLARVDPSSVPSPPGQLVGPLIRMTASPCGGPPYTTLPSEVNLGVTYSDEVAAGRDESKFELMFFDGQQWATAPKLYTDPANNHVSASVTGLGVYALVQR